MAYFPMFIDIEKKKCLVAGGGTVALRKVRVLLDFGAQITVVAPQIDPQILQLTGNVCVKERTFEPEDLKECVLVVAATDDVTENHRIARMAQKKHIPVNAVDQQEDCSFIFPSYLKHRDLVGAFSSAGNSPVLTQYLKESPERNSDGRTGDRLTIIWEVFIFAFYHRTDTSHIIVNLSQFFRQNFFQRFF